MIQNLAIASVAAFGAQITFYLIHEKRFSAVRASSSATLVFVLTTMIFSNPLVALLQGAFFGSTFVGMTSKNRLGKKRVLLASIIFAAIYILVLPLFQGIGGGLGTAAFASCAGVYVIDKFFRAKTY